MSITGYIAGDGTPVSVDRDHGLPVQGAVGVEQTIDGKTNGVRLTSQYPGLATPVAAYSGTLAAAIGTVTLPGVAGKTLYLTGVLITSSGATSGLAVAPTITGLLGGTMTLAHVFPAGVLVQSVPTQLCFNPGIPAAGPGVSIVGVLPSSGSGGTNATINLFGYYI